jgi:hypothetical protein
VAPEQPPESAASPLQDAPADESPLHPGGERVYDLSEFDAISLREEEPVADDEADRIYDLSEFGAVALN